MKIKTISQVIKFFILTIITLSLGIKVDAQSLSSDMNYVVESVVKDAGFKDRENLSGMPVELVNRNIQFLDGWGRPIQEIKWLASPTKKDVVTRLAYDVNGKQRYQYFPYSSSTGTSGNFKVNAAYDQAFFYYSSINGNIQEIKTDAPYAQTVFEASPLGRVLEKGIGETWGVGSASTKYDYSTNKETGNDIVKNWILTTNGAEVAGNYQSGKLFLVITKDENWKYTDGKAGTTEEFKDLEGKLVLKRVWESSSKSLNTYYIYDVFGNLRYVLPPAVNENGIAVINQFTENDVSFNSYIYGYHYDERSRTIEKKNPGSGWSYVVYNNKDQIVMTQDALQKNNNDWIFLKYDAFGRQIIAGLYNSSDPVKDRSYFQTLFNNHIGKLSEDRENNSIGYSNNIFPQTVASYHNINYYDSYDFPGNVFGVPDQLNQVSGVQVKNLLTGSKVGVLGTNNLLLTVNYYDIRGRVVKSNSQNHLGGTDVITRTYSFTGELLIQNQAHKASASGEITNIKNSYIYDHIGRMIAEKSQINSQAEVTLSTNVYNELGQLKYKYLHGSGPAAAENVELNINASVEAGNTSSITAGSSITLTDGFYASAGSNFSAIIVVPAVQQIGYSYNERGWLTQINRPETISDKKIFGMSLNYNNSIFPSHGPTYLNGNVNRITWQTKVPSGLGLSQKIQQYDFEYDKLNRLTKSNYSGDGKNNFFNEELDYDVMGNITSLKRTNGSTSLFNNLSYNYVAPISGAIGNQLYGVSDAGSGGINSSFTYDLNGNQLSNSRLGITTIAYNYLNLPKALNIGSQVLEYTYSAGGNKLQKRYGTDITDYLGAIQYKAGSIESIATSEGRMIKSGNVYIYVYFLKDHLGNTRAVVDQTGSIKQVQDYYAFGLAMNPGNTFSSSPPNQYKYNGKELQEELGQYDYGARFYDPVIGRWNVIDPLAESYHAHSPYNYALNDPIGKLDPNGMWVETAGGYSTNNPDEIAAFFGQNKTQENDPEDPKKKGRNMVNKPGAIIRKTQNGYSVSQVKKGEGNDDELNNWMELGVGFTPAGIAFDIRNAIEGEDMAGENLSWGWRLAGIVPLVSEFKMGTKIAKVSGWVKRSVFESLDPAVQKKVADAIKKGIVAPTGNSGIIKLTASEAKATGYTHKVKILGKGGDLRIYGNQEKNGHVVFDKVMGH